jgi:hypothetical protein
VVLVVATLDQQLVRQVIRLLLPQRKVLLAAVKCLRFHIKAVVEAVLALLAVMPLPVQLTTEVLAVVAVQALAQPSQAKEFFMLVEAGVALTLPPQELV